MPRKYGETGYLGALNPFTQAKAMKEREYQKKATAAANAQRAKDARKRAEAAKPAAERFGTKEYWAAQVGKNKKTKVVQPGAKKTMASKSSATSPTRKTRVMNKRKKDEY